MQALPKVLPVNALKNTANIMKVCQESEGPIVITRNGYGEAVMMSVKVYEELFEKMRIATLVNESLDNMRNGGKLSDADAVFNELEAKYGK